jgi:hypothetical protein
VLTGLFTAVFYGVNAPLDSGNYYNLLYQEGVQPKFCARELVVFPLEVSAKTNPAFVADP